MNKQTLLKSSLYPAICRIVNLTGLKTKKLNGGGIKSRLMRCFVKAKSLSMGTEVM